MAHCFPSSPHLVPCRATTWRVQGTATSVDTRGVRNWGQWVWIGEGKGDEEMRWGLLCAFGENLQECNIYKYLQGLTNLTEMHRMNHLCPTALLPYKTLKYQDSAKMPSKGQTEVRLIG